METIHKQMRGFATLSAERRREIARKGGASVPGEKRSFAVNRELASEAGRKGWEVRWDGGRRRADGSRPGLVTPLIGRQADGDAVSIGPDIVTFAVAREPGGWFFTGPQRVGPFPTRVAAFAAAEILASWVRADGQDAEVIYASSPY